MPFVALRGLAVTEGFSTERRPWVVGVYPPKWACVSRGSGLSMSNVAQGKDLGGLGVWMEWSICEGMCTG